MSRKGLWSCEPCARQHDLLWLGQQASYDRPQGWCGMTQHRVSTRLEWIPDAEPAIHVSDYVFGGVQPLVAVAAEPAPAPSPPPPQQMDLF